jgi:alkyl hydroperoxide reductase subunit AhpC
VTQLAPLHPEFTSLNTHVFTVTFGHPYWAQAWLQETASPFPVLLDPTQDVYQLYGLDHSAVRSSSVKTLLYYARALLRGEKLIEKRGDTHQLGGNFIIDKQGIVQFVYPSRDPTDRPPVDAMMRVLKRLQSSA